MAQYGKIVYGSGIYGTTSDWVFNRSQLDAIQGNAYINYNDLKRIEENLADMAKKFGVSITGKTDWSAFDSKIAYTTFANFPTADRMTRIISNLSKVVRASKYNPTVKIPSTFEYATIDTMNNIEKILFELYQL